MWPRASFSSDYNDVRSVAAAYKKLSGAARHPFQPTVRLLHSARRAEAPRCSVSAGWSSPVARQAHNLKVAGSNPAPATKLSPLHQSLKIDVTDFRFCTRHFRSASSMTKDVDRA